MNIFKADDILILNRFARCHTWIIVLTQSFRQTSVSLFDNRESEERETVKESSQKILAHLVFTNEEETKDNKLIYPTISHFHHGNDTDLRQGEY